ncbi:GAF domain-containing protein [Mycolicibacterium sp. P1-18]|uniref:aspartate racemase/maleate isomerase family protein n=1 Tax=Mycolicibacterium sp. P1-18 TaxID=2024615 RepID=UPI0011F2E741|nr:GAF domain-containing protein [Mycolicibacterium sp. P1-18]KAA0090837.1 GAF domain-containing protein [Mycolicibacterium sp. P1-18]
MTQIGRRLGFICPSSNTAFEPAAWALLADGASMHVTRVGVTRIALESASDVQFDVSGMTAAARLLAEARVDVVAWAGTSGSWLGVDRDRALCDALAAAAGVPATTSTLAVLEACRAYGVDRLGLVSPYTADVSARIAEELGRNGIQVVDEQYRGLATNFDFASVGPDDVASMIAAAAHGADAVAVMCTNVDGVAPAARVGAQLGTPVFDSIGATVWHAAGLAGDDAPMPALGELGVSGRLRAGMQTLTEHLRHRTGGDRTTLRIDLPAAGCSVGTCAAESHGPTVRSIRRDATLPQRDLDTVRWIEQHRRPLVQPDFARVPRPPLALVDVYGVRAQMLAPVVLGADMVGWLSVHSLTERAWTDADQLAVDLAARDVEALLAAHANLVTV